MNYRKFKADQIFDGSKYLDGNSVLITDEHGYILDIVNEEEAGDEIENYHGLLSPGFVNCHCHLELSHLKGKIEQGNGLVQFVSNVMKNRSASDEDVLNTMAEAEKEMFENGIEAVGDICNTNFTLQQKSKENLNYYNFIEATGFLENNAAERFVVFEELAKEFEQLSAACIVPHAAYSVSRNLLKLISEQQPGKTISMHNQESVAEHDFFFSGKGEFYELYKNLNLDISSFKHPQSSSIEYFFRNFRYEGNIILVHNVTTTTADIINAEKISKENNAILYWCFCPNANEYISNRLPEINLFIEEDVNIVLGTDSLASNHQLSILEEMKTIASHFPKIKLEQMLQWATLNGAKALQMQDFIGSFEKGKKPGVVLIGGWVDTGICEDSRVRRLL